MDKDKDIQKLQQVVADSQLLFEALKYSFNKFKETLSPSHQNITSGYNFLCGCIEFVLAIKLCVIFDESSPNKHDKSFSLIKLYNEKKNAMNNQHSQLIEKSKSLMKKIRNLRDQNLAHLDLDPSSNNECTEKRFEVYKQLLENANNLILEMNNGSIFAMQNPQVTLIGLQKIFSSK